MFFFLSCQESNVSSQLEFYRNLQSNIAFECSSKSFELVFGSFERKVPASTIFNSESGTRSRLAEIFLGSSEADFMRPGCNVKVQKVRIHPKRSFFTVHTGVCASSERNGRSAGFPALLFWILML